MLIIPTLRWRKQISWFSFRH